MFGSDEDAAFLVFDATWRALRAGDLEQLEELTIRSPFPCGTDGWLGHRWLSTAVETGNLSSVAWVLSKSPEVNYIDSGGFTVLESALQGEVSFSKKISSPLIVKEMAERTIALIDLLLRHGTDINLRMNLGYTALHTAAAWSSPEVMLHLLARGADPLAIAYDYDPITPADIAKRAKRWEVHAILRRAMGQTPAGLPIVD